MSDEPMKRTQARVWWTLCVLLALNPLSVGPAAWIVARTELRHQKTYETPGRAKPRLSANGRAC
jgi:hypothetical protein